jgi:hypothetical protein
MQVTRFTGLFKTRDQHAILEEEEFIALLFVGRSGLMLDVGASKGNACDVYLGKGWQVHSFEPDPDNRETLVTRFGCHPALTINPEAASNESGLELP